MTPRQLEVLNWLREWFWKNSISPTFDEIREGNGMTSKSNAHHALVRLRERGHVSWIPHRARAIRLIDQEDPARVAARNLLENGLVDEDEETGLATVKMEALGALELALLGEPS